jgi:hypothetical protein
MAVAHQPAEELPYCFRVPLLTFWKTSEPRLDVRSPR